MYFIDRRAGLLTTLFTVIYIVIAIILYRRSRNLVFNEFVSFATKYGQVQRQLLRELELPYALMDEAGKKFSAWTLDTEDAIKKAIDMGVDTYFTNDTPLALEIEREYGLKVRSGSNDAE